MRPTRERVESRKQKRLCTDAPADLRPSLKHQSDSDFRKPLEILLTVRRDLVLFEQGRSAPEAEGAPCVIMFDRIPSRALNRSKITPGRLPKPLLGTNDIKKGHHTVLIESCLQSSPPENRNGTWLETIGDFAAELPIRSLETVKRIAEARQRAFLTLLRVESPGVGLGGWRRSADRTRLHTNSLLTGNFTGNLAISEL
jgi:hypothetical protein